MLSANEGLFRSKIADNVFLISKLDELGISKKYTGYYYMVSILDLIVNDERSVKSYSREVFPKVAKLFGKTTCTVERNIRFVIQACWGEEICKKLKCFYVPNIKPTCCQFISLVKSYILSFLL